MYLYLHPHHSGWVCVRLNLITSSLVSYLTLLRFLGVSCVMILPVAEGTWGEPPGCTGDSFESQLLLWRMRLPTPHRPKAMSAPVTRTTWSVFSLLWLPAFPLSSFPPPSPWLLPFPQKPQALTLLFKFVPLPLEISPSIPGFAHLLQVFVFTFPVRTSLATSVYAATWTHFDNVSIASCCP